MENKNWNLISYTLPNGKVPLDDYLDNLHNVKYEMKIYRDLQLLEEFGVHLKGSHIDYLEDGIFELRTKFSSNIFRITLFFWHHNNIVLLHGFTKKTQKIPSNEIQKAKTYKDDFLRREQLSDGIPTKST